MTNSEFMLLTDPGEMVEEIKRNPEFNHDDECWAAMWKRDEEIEREWQIKYFGYYDPDILFDPLPIDPNNR